MCYAKKHTTFCILFQVIYVKKPKIFLVVICLILGFTSCSTPQLPMVDHTHPKVLRYALFQDPSTLDPQKVDATSEATIAYHIYEGLMRSYGDQLLYGIAHSYEISTDGLVYTFYLRDATYSDGTPIRAQDFVYAVQRMLTDEDSSRPFMAYSIKNASKIHQKELPMDHLGVWAVDDKTLKFVLENPTPYFLQLLALPTFSPIPAQSDPSAPINIKVSNGPFQLKEWNHNNSILLEKNPHYWDADKIQLDQVSIFISSDRSKLLDMFFNREIDILPIAPTDVPESFSSYIQYYYNGANDFIRLNMDGSCPLSNKNLRLALNYALDRNAYVNALGLDGVTAISRYVLPILPGTHKTFGEEYPMEAFPLNGDEQKAHHYLKTALQELGLEKATDIHLELLITDDYWSVTEAQIIKEQLEKTLGIQITVLSVPYNTHMDLENAHKFQMSLSGWIPEYADPATYLELWTSDSSYNYASYRSEEYDECFHTANSQMDSQSRMSLLAQAEAILLEDGALIPLQIRQSALLKNPKLTNFQTYYINTEYQYIYADFLA